MPNHSAKPHSFSQAGNLLELIPTRRPHEFWVRLNTPFRPRFIGTLDLKGDGTFKTRRHEKKHLHRNSNSIAINAALLANPELQFAWVEVELLHADGSEEMLITSRAYLKAKGNPLCFNNFEPQVALELSLWGREKANRFKREMNSQRDLFSQVPS